ncbi:MAG: hypothetical protein B7Z55_05520 [Planctomycetales bacterium 12-60-4]|nr:MAG: hypothetical protein B7Z55_05520 [Planctomycetales bacterium 12-60-4]
MLQLREAQASQTGQVEPDTSVIFVWMPGGPPHMEMYDLKPDAPAEYRGEFRPIATTVPGLDVCELMPRHAKIAHKYNVVRSIAHQFADHGGGHKRFMTGRDPKTPVGFENDAPAVGSIVAKTFENRKSEVPNYACIVEPGRQQVDTFSQGAAYLGPSYTPFMVPGDPSSDKFQVPNIAPIAEVSGRLDDRTRLLSQFDHFRRQADQSGLMNSMDKFHERAMALLTSEKCKEAFDLSREDESVRQQYGKHAWGQRLLMARRLVEAGCTFCTVIIENPYQSGVEWLKQGTYNWDSHAVNCHMFDDLKLRLPIYDQAVTALIDDLYYRGLDKRVLVVVTGEFGRTPRVTNVVGSQTGVMQPGRDHWPQAMSLITFGGGQRTGQVIGSTNSKGEHPKDRPLTPNDLWATVYRHLGIDFHGSFPDHRGRPMPILPYGAPIDELLPVA